METLTLYRLVTWHEHGASEAEIHLCVEGHITLCEEYEDSPVLADLLTIWRPEHKIVGTTTVGYN